MPVLSDFRSDYPLNLTLLERWYAGALKQSYRAGLTSARRIPVPLVGSNLWFLSQLLVDSAFDGQHQSGTHDRKCRSIEHRICRWFRTKFCSSACTPSPSESTCGLRQVRAWVREFRLNINEQLAHLVEHWSASPRGTRRHYSYALPLSLLSPNLALYAVVAIHMPSTWGRHSPITIVLCPAFQMRNPTEGVHFASITL
jgi:hypothetical protein